jgi:hypothetical protein
MSSILWSTRRTTLPLTLFIWFTPMLAWAQLPLARLNAVFPAGGRQGSTVAVTLSGNDLDDVDRLWFSHAGITAQRVMLPADDFHPQPRPDEGKFTVAIAAGVPPGMYEARAVGRYGASNPRFFVVDTREEIVETEPNNRFDQAGEAPWGAIVNGQANGADRDFFRFTGKAGARLLVDCQARRIDSRFDPMLVLYDRAGQELASAHDGSHRDTLLDYTLPADGEYMIEVRDFVYSGGGDYFYRLVIGAGPHVDFVFPPAGLPGSNEAYEIYGRNLPGGQLMPGLTVDGRPLERVTANIALPSADEARRLSAGRLIEPAESQIDAVIYRHPTPQGPANPVLIGVATAPIVREQEPNNSPDKATKLSLPCECVGQFESVADHDWFTFEAKKGDEYAIEVISQRLGQPTDPYLLVQQVTVNKKGEEQIKDLQQTDDIQNGNFGGFDFDTQHDDPIYRFVAPADGQYRVLLRDLYASSRGDPRFVYRLAIRPVAPDFRLVAFSQFPGALPNQPQSLVWSPYLRKGGSERIEVVAFRRDGFNGEITITAEGLPAGVTAAPAVIGPDQTSTALVLTAADNAAATVAPFRVVGQARLPSGDATRQARSASIVWAGQPGQFNARSRLSGDLVLSVSAAEIAPFGLQVGPPPGGKVWEMSRAGKIEIPVRMLAHGDFKGAVIVSPLGLPRGMQPVSQQMNVSADEAKFAINLQTNAPLGEFSFALLGTSEANYRHNPEAADAAAKYQADVQKIVAERQAALQEANKKKNATSEAARQAEAEMKRLAQTVDAANKADAEAKKQLDTAMAQLREAEAALEKNQQSSDLANQVEAAKKQVATADESAKKAVEAKVAAEKALAAATAQAKQAADEKTSAEKLATQADAKLKAANQAKTRADQESNRLKNQAQPRNVNVGFPSSPITIKVTPAPIAVAALPAARVTQSEKIEVPITINRLYGYTDQVRASAQAPSGVNGLNLQQVVIAANQNDGKLVIMAAADATPGKHELRLQFNLQFNNQGLQLVEKMTLEVEKK